MHNFSKDRICNKCIHFALCKHVSDFAPISFSHSSTSPGFPTDDESKLYKDFRQFLAQHCLEFKSEKIR